MTLPPAVSWALDGRRVAQWATAMRAWEACCLQTGTPGGLPPDYAVGQERMCAFIYRLGMDCGLRCATVSKYVSAVFSWWRCVDPRLAPGKEGGLYRLALARYAEFDRRLPQQYAHVTVELLVYVILYTAPDKTVRAAIIFGYSFVCRTGEFVQSGSGDGWDRNLVCADQVEYLDDVGGGRRGLRVRFLTRKNNPATMGAEQLQERHELIEGDTTLCVVRAMFRDARRAPRARARRRAGARADLPA